MQCLDIALSLRCCLGGLYSGDEEDEEGADSEGAGNELCSVTQHSSTAVLGALLSAGEALVGEAESAITNRKTKNKT